MKKIVSLSLALLLVVEVLTGCEKITLQTDATAKCDTFAKGADISILKRLEDVGAVYSENGKTKDALQIFKDHGFNWMRLRLFHTPNWKGPVCNDIPYTLELAKRIKAHRFALLLDFHYSDTWADPGKQYIPAAWKGLSHEQLEQKVFEYTRNTIATFREEGCLPDMVQLGNEITNGTLWPDSCLGGEFDTPQQWARLAGIVKAGIRGVKAGAGPNNCVKIMVHIDRGGDRTASEHFFDNLLARGVDFDVIGLSYYPFWHGSFDDLRENLKFLTPKYKKPIIVVETGCPWAPQRFYDGDVLLSVEESTRRFLPYPPTPQGQKAFLTELMQIVRNTPNNRGKGVFYWAPEWIPAKAWGKPNYSLTWEHRALFDLNGKMLPAMKAFEE